MAVRLKSEHTYRADMHSSSACGLPKRRRLPICLPALHSWLPGGLVILLCHFVTHSIHRLLLRHLLLLFSIQFIPYLPPSIIILILCMASTCSPLYMPFLATSKVCVLLALFCPSPPPCLVICGEPWTDPGCRRTTWWKCG